MANPEHVAKVREGSESLNQWRREHPAEALDLSFADLSRIGLRDGDLSGSDLRGANLTAADLHGTNFERADLTGANLTRANLSFARFRGAKLENAITSGADVVGAVFGEGQRFALAARTKATWYDNDSLVVLLLSGVSIAGIALLAYQGRIIHIEFARGLITVIFGIGTISLALILVGSRWLADSQDADARFKDSKEVLTLFVGIFGTVVGWYFGQDSRAEADSGPAIAAIAISDLKPRAGATFRLTIPVIGGKAPFKYALRFGDGKILVPLSGSGSGRMIVQEVKVPETAPTSVELPVKVDVTDAEERSTSFVTATGAGISITGGTPQKTK